MILNGKNPCLDPQPGLQKIVLMNKEKQVMAMGHWVSKNWKYDFVVGG